MRAFALRERPIVTTCPLDPSWRLWDMLNPARSNHYAKVTPGEWEICAAARRLRPVQHRGLVPLEWEAAADDARYRPMTPAESNDVDWRWDKESPSHLHADLAIQGVAMHIDRAAATKYGPGRFYREFRIFVNGYLAGRAGCCGCSLGAGGGNLPAVAIVGRDLAITVDDDAENGEPIVELWQVREPTPDERARS